MSAALLNLVDARAALGGISDKQIRNLIRSGDLPAVYQGARIYVTPAAIDAYVASLAAVDTTKPDSAA